jgi:hypothetical protein
MHISLSCWYLWVIQNVCVKWVNDSFHSLGWNLQFPIGIDSDRFKRALELPAVKRHISELTERFAGRKVWKHLSFTYSRTNLKSIIVNENKFMHIFRFYMERSISNFLFIWYDLWFWILNMVFRVFNIVG